MWIRMFLFYSLLTGTHWVRIKDSYPQHQRLLNSYGNLMGEYYRVPDMTGPFTAQCYEGAPAIFPTEDTARAFVLKCEVW